MKIFKPIPLNLAALASNPEYSSIISLVESSLLEPLMVSPVATPRLKSFISSDFSIKGFEKHLQHVFLRQNLTSFKNPFLCRLQYRLSKQNRLGALSFSVSRL